MQRNIVLGRRPQRDGAVARSRVPSRTLPGAIEALSLAKYRLASRWRSLLWFWLSILSLAALGGLVLEILGPPPKRTADVQAPPQAAILPTRPARPPAAPAGLTAPAAVPAPAALAPAQPEPDPASAPQPSPVPDTQAPGNTAQQDAPSRGRVLMVLHPARSEGSAAIAGTLAARTGLDSDQIGVGTTGEARSAAVIRFYSTGDHALARRLGQELARMGYTWKIENFAARSWAWKDQAIEVFLPDR